MWELGQTFVAGILLAGLFRLSVGQIVLFENGKWTLRFSRFDVREEAINVRVNEAMSLGYRKGIADMTREFSESASKFEEVEDAMIYAFFNTKSAASANGVRIENMNLDVFLREMFDAAHSCNAIRKLGEQRDASD